MSVFLDYAFMSFTHVYSLIERYHVVQQVFTEPGIRAAVYDSLLIWKVTTTKLVTAELESLI